jgi:hypothetical protein
MIENMLGARLSADIGACAGWDIVSRVPSCAYVGLFLVLLCTGCGNRHENRASISGEMKLDGRPIEQGSIQFLPMQGVEGSITGGDVVKGRYQLSGKAGPAVGWNRVEIHGLRKTGKTIPKPFPQQGTVEELVEAVAPRYNSESTLKVEVKPGDNTADFEVTSK